MTPYSELRRLVEQASRHTPKAELARQARTNLFRSRILRSLRDPKAVERRRSLLLTARAAFSILRGQK